MNKVPMEEGDQFIIMASDGLWDVMTSEEAVNFVHSVMSAHVGALREGGDSDEIPSDRPGKKGKEVGTAMGWLGSECHVRRARIMALAPGLGLKLHFPLWPPSASGRVQWT